MKKLLLLIFPFALSLTSSAQWDINLDFENGLDSIIKIDTVIMPNNQWQIGTPSKTYMDSAYSPTHALMTDTINPYFGPSVSRAAIKWGSEQGHWACMYVNLSFFHKFDVDSLVDGCSVEFSYDGGLSFINVSTYAATGHGYLQHQNIATGEILLDGNLPNNKIGLSGNSGGWIQTFIQLYDNNCTWQTDSLILHFVFRANSSNPNNLEGWIIDDIQLSTGIVESVPEISFSSTLYPNPATNTATIDFENPTNTDFSLQVFDFMGRLTSPKTPLVQERGRITIDVSDLAPGIYHYRLISEKEQKQSFGKFVVQ